MKGKVKFLVLAVVFSVFFCMRIDLNNSVNAQAISENDFVLSSGGENGQLGVGVAGYKGEENVVVIPNMIGGKPVTRVQFTGNKTVEKLVIPASVIEISGGHESQDGVPVNPFHGCENLKEIEVASENPLFCSEGGLLYSKDMKALVAVPPAYEGICNIPDSVENLRFEYEDWLLTDFNHALLGTSKVTGFDVGVNNKVFSSKNGILYSKDGKTLLAYPGGNLTENVEILSGVKTIGERAFSGNLHIKTVKTPVGLREIASYAFEKCRYLKKVECQKGLRFIRRGAFYGDASLTSCKLPMGLERIEYDAFTGTWFVFTAKTLPASAVYANRMEIQTAEDELKSAGSNKKQTYLYKSFAKISIPKVSRKKVTAKIAKKGKGKATTAWYKKEKKKFTISTPDELAGLAKLVKKGVTFKGKTIKLANNLDMSCYKNWLPIGSYSFAEYRTNRKHDFQGIFNGNGNTIYNLKVNRQYTPQVGLFAAIGKNGAVKNLNIKNASVLGYAAVGGVAGYSLGKIENCSFSGKVAGRTGVGGIVGEVESSGKKQIVLKKCTNSGAICGTSYVGGIVGKSITEKEVYVSINKCKNNGKVSGYFDVAGIFGIASGEKVKAVMVSCKNKGKILGLFKK